MDSHHIVRLGPSLITVVYATLMRYIYTYSGHPSALILPLGVQSRTVFWRVSLMKNERRGPDFFNPFTTM